MGRIPEKCENWKVARCPLFRWWCKLVCGGLTGGRLCSPWCRMAERFGLWTLLLTLAAPIVIIIFLIFYM